LSTETAVPQGFSHSASPIRNPVERSRVSKNLSRKKNLLAIIDGLGTRCGGNCGKSCGCTLESPCQDGADVC